MNWGGQFFESQIRRIHKIFQLLFRPSFWVLLFAFTVRSNKCYATLYGRWKMKFRMHNLNCCTDVRTKNRFSRQEGRVQVLGCDLQFTARFVVSNHLWSRLSLERLSKDHFISSAGCYISSRGWFSFTAAGRFLNRSGIVKLWSAGAIFKHQDNLRRTAFWGQNDALLGVIQHIWTLQ